MGISRRPFLLGVGTSFLATAPKAQLLCSCGPPVSSAAQQFLSRIVDPGPAWTARYNTLFQMLVAAGILSKLDALYIYKGPSSATALTNLIQNSYNATLVNAPSFTYDQGFTGSSNSYIDTGFNPATAVNPKFVQNNSCAFAYSLSQQTIVGGIFGTITGSKNYIYPRITNGTGDVRVNGSAGTGTDVCSDGSGFLLGSRTGVNSYSTYRDGASQGSSATVSQTPDNSNFCFLRASSDYYVGGIVAAGGFGSGLTAAEQLALFIAIDTFLYEGYDIIPQLGQSNIFSGFEIDPAIDTQGGYVDQWITAGHKAGGNEPIQQHGTTINASSIGHGMTFARDGYGPVVAAPLRRKALIVGCALGSSAIDRWVPGGDLNIDAIAKINAALTWRTGNRVVCYMWDQGEGNDGTSQGSYAASMDLVIPSFRAVVTAANAPFLIAGLGDAFLAANPTALGVQAALVDTPNRNARCAFVSAAGLAMDGNIHFTAVSQRIFAYPRHWNAYLSI